MRSNVIPRILDLLSTYPGLTAKQILEYRICTREELRVLTAQQHIERYGQRYYCPGDTPANYRGIQPESVLSQFPGLTKEQLLRLGVTISRLVNAWEAGAILRRGDRYYMPQDAPPPPTVTPVPEAPIKVYRLEDLRRRDCLTVSQ